MFSIEVYGREYYRQRLGARMRVYKCSKTKPISYFLNAQMLSYWNKTIRFCQLYSDNVYGCHQSIPFATFKYLKNIVFLNTLLQEDWFMIVVCNVIRFYFAAFIFVHNNQSLGGTTTSRINSWLEDRLLVSSCADCKILHVFILRRKFDGLLHM